MTLPEKIKSIYPQLQDDDFVNIIRVQDDCDGKGAYIVKWGHPTLARPTEEQLA